MRRLFYMLYHLAYFLLGSVPSRAINTIFFGGSMHQTLSARAFVESHFSDGWADIRDFLDALFFWSEDHCKDGWEAEVSRARKTLDYNLDEDEWSRWRSELADRPKKRKPQDGC